MGDVESGGGAWDGAAEAGGTGASLSMSGGSLPPRKRLLAGLKQQNGGWLGSSSPSASAVTSPASVLHSSGTSGAAGGQGLDARGLDEGTVVVPGTAVKQEDGCMSCGGQDGGAGWRRIKRSGVFHRLCNPCAQLFSKNMCCPYCLVGYHDLSQLGDPAVWLPCCKCRRSVHVACELKQGARTKTDPASYACPECSQTRRLREPPNGFKGRGFSSRVGTNSAPEAGQCMSSAAAECSSPSSHKKPRMSREPRRPIDPVAAHHQAERATMDGGAGPASASKAGFSALSRKGAPRHPSPISAEEAAAAAKAAAAAATKAAAAAKAVAAAKASVAVKAAAAAKAALEAAALAARAEAQARAELRRNSSRSDVRASMTSKLSRESSGNSEKEKVERLDNSRPDKLEVKTEKTEDDKVLPASIDDGELARQLHREINSSPRISRSSINPLRRKASGRMVPAQLGSPISDGAARVWPRGGTPTEPRSQHKHQQTRPRSFMCKDGKRLDARIARHDYKRPEDEVTESGAPTSDFEEGPFDSLQHLEADVQPMDVKAEPVDAAECFALDTAGVPALSKPEPDLYNTSADAAVGLIQDSEVPNGACIPALIQGGINATGSAQPVITGDGAAGSDIAMDADFREDASRWEQNEALSLMATLIAEDDYRGRDQEIDDHLTAEEIAQVSASVTAAEGQDAANRDMQAGDGLNAESSGGALEAGVQPPDAIVHSETFQSLSPNPRGEGTGQASGALDGAAGSPRPTFEQDTVETLADAERDTVADESNDGDSEPSPRNGSAGNGGRTGSGVVAGNGESWHSTKLKGLASGGQTFTGGVSISSFGPATSLPVCTPAVASGATGRHV